MFAKRLLKKPGLSIPQQFTTNITRSLTVNCKYLQFDEFGDPDKVVKKYETTLETPKPNEVLVKILAAPINPADINIIQGQCQLF